jgi:hypothetical protein
LRVTKISSEDLIADSSSLSAHRSSFPQIGNDDCIIGPKNSFSDSFYEMDEKPPLTEPVNCMMQHIYRCIRYQEMVQFFSLHITESQVEMTKKSIEKAHLDLKESEKEHRKTEKEATIWKDVGHVASGLSGVVSICIGVALIPSGPVGAIAGVAMIISGCASIGSLVCEKTGVSSDITLGIQIAGGIASLAGGIGAFATGIANMNLLMKIGSGLFTAAQYAAGGISDINQMKGVEHEAVQTAFQATLEISYDQIKEHGKLWGEIQDHTSHTLGHMIDVCIKEGRIIDDIVNKELTGGA